MFELIQSLMNTMNTGVSPSDSSSSSTLSTNELTLKQKSSSSLNMWRTNLWPFETTIVEQDNCNCNDDDDDDDFNDLNDNCNNELPEYTLSEVSEHWQTNDCWIVVENYVYNITEFLDEHPGGQYIIMEHAGRDATLVFRGSRHSQDAYNMLDKYLIGILVENERIYWNRSRSNTNVSNNSLYGSSPQPSKGL